MIIMRLHGGLGNIMFQYALGRHLSIKNDALVKYDVSLCKINPLGDYSLSLEAFTIDIEKNLATRLEILKYTIHRKRKGAFWHPINYLLADQSKYYEEKYFNFDPDILSLQNDVYLAGWFQSEKYFAPIREVLLKDFTIKKPLGEKTAAMAKRIQSTESISMHVRRLDYVANPKTKKFHGELEKSYYDRALAKITETVKNPIIYIFSDDITWVEQHFSFPYETVYVESDIAIPLAHEDMHLMSLCKHNIVANSSYSWWGAWLNNNPGKIVVAPEPWFKSTLNNTKDLVPESWIKVEN